MGGVPDFEGFITQCWGSPAFIGSGCWFAGASNVVVGTNPPYFADDFLATYPWFGGIAIVVTGTTVEGSAVIDGIPQTGVAAIGQLISSPNFPKNSVVIAVVPTTNDTPGSITVSQPATVTGAVTANVYTQPPIPLVALNAYIALASASLVQARWLDLWQMGMQLYVAHFVTLYLRTAATPGDPAGVIASKGLAQGITVSKSAGPVSQGLQVPSGLEGWGAWQITGYGQQFATFAAAVGSGSLWIR